MAHFIGLDIGTSGVKSLLVDLRGTVVATSVQEYPMSTPRPLWAEQNPEDWWSVCREVSPGRFVQSEYLTVRNCRYWTHRPNAWLGLARQERQGTEAVYNVE